MSSIDLTSILSNQTWSDIVKPDQKSLFLSNSHLQNIYLQQYRLSPYIYTVYLFNPEYGDVSFLLGFYDDVSKAKQMLIDVFGGNPDAVFYEFTGRDYRELDENPPVLKRFGAMTPRDIFYYINGVKGYIYKNQISDDKGDPIALTLNEGAGVITEIKGTKLFEIEFTGDLDTYDYQIIIDDINKERSVILADIKEIYIVRSYDDVTVVLSITIFTDYLSAKNYYDNLDDEEVGYTLYKYVLNSRGFYLDSVDMFFLPKPVLEKLEEKIIE